MFCFVLLCLFVCFFFQLKEVLTTFYVTFYLMFKRYHAHFSSNCQEIISLEMTCKIIPTQKCTFYIYLYSHLFKNSGLLSSYNKVTVALYYILIEHEITKSNYSVILINTLSTVH